MSDVDQKFEVLENRLMRAWMNRDAREMKSLVSADCIFMFGINPPVLLDRASFVAGMDRGMVCDAFRFQEVTARQYGKNVWFSGHIELEMKLGLRKWTGNFLVTDLWRKGAMRRRWALAERTLSPVDNNSEMSDAIRALQLWQ